MVNTIRASFANGVFTPLEPLPDIEEGSLFVLNIEMVSPNSEAEEPELGVAPDDDPKRLKTSSTKWRLKTNCSPASAGAIL